MDAGSCRLQAVAVRAGRRPRHGADREHGRRRAGPGGRGQELLKDARAPADLRRARLPGKAARGQRPQQRRCPGHPGGRSRARVRHRPVLERQRRLRRRRAPRRLAVQGLRPRPAGAVHGAQRRHALGPRVGHQGGPGKPPGHRHHQRLGPGRRADVLVRRAGVGQGRLRRADVRSAGPGPVRHARRGARRARGRAGPDRRPPVLRRHRGRARTSCSPRPSTRTTRCRVRDGHEPRRQAGRTRRRRPRRRLQPVLATC